MSAAPASAPPAAVPVQAPTVSAPGVHAAFPAPTPPPSRSPRPSRPPRFALSDVQESVIRLLAEGASAGDAATQAGVHRSTIYHWQRTNLLFATRLNESRHEVACHFRDQFHARADKALATVDRLLDDPATPAAVQARLALAILNAAATPLEPARILAHALDHTINAPMPCEDEDSRYLDFANQADDPAFPFHDEETEPIDSGEDSLYCDQPEPCTSNPGKEAAPSTNFRQSSTNPTSFSSNKRESGQIAGETAAHPANQVVASAADRQPAPEKPQPIRRTEPRIGRNAPCPCGSGQKFKRCCGGNR